MVGTAPTWPRSSVWGEDQRSRAGVGRAWRQTAERVIEQGFHQGLFTLFCQHTSAWLLIQDNVAPEVRSDLESYFAEIAPEDLSAYAHDDEGPMICGGHLRTTLTQVIS